MKKVLTLVALMALGACSGQQANNTAEPVNVSSLGKSEITDVRAADAMPTYPKRGASIERGFVHQPPLIPHKADYSITIKKNGCMTCHSPAKAKRMKATMIHSSHILADNKLNNEYFNCTQCHVPQAENKQKLVENNFSNQ
ncbi:periplasmic nitrate reductase, electron transfer subunit [Shewanella colwelliana]|uniref:Periplasmic nitrate reductase, electron transfer subunit n=1 Tax=Shewanella colwelliana TaxID=23 RepID=A0A1E5IVT3_SHECO|nr:nitrate reductase cytochrome c-type subunit [Shewanella colwelliana]MDX1283164.1 nitrate reductase cytochrome c-type subunit [Shewanella colwelliana]OEG74188.1 nitrate reductase [Shewanella colwelliana]GIU20297.1 periplasmic nitrate reductase, electron transfer subunit [Shewanella colwelliana]GIU35386.1 periplasmic nitrate reductase, electron transfer subunit [Shewanella colwelliana]